MNTLSFWENNYILIPMVLGMFGLAAVLAVWIVKRASAAKPKEAAVPATPFLWVFLLLGYSAIFLSRTRGPHPPQWVWVGVAVAGVLAAVMVAILVIRQIDWALRRALRRGGTVEGLEALIAKKPTQHRINVLGTILLDADRKEEAAEQFRRAAEMGPPHSSMCLSNLGWTLCGLNRPEEAEETLRQALLAKPDMPAVECLIHLNLASALTALERREEAQEHFQKAEELREGLPSSEKSMLREVFEKRRLTLGGGPGGDAIQDASAGSPQRRGDS